MKGVNYGRKIAVTVQPGTTWREEVIDAPPCRLDAILTNMAADGSGIRRVDNGLMVTASIGVTMLWRYPVAPSKLVNLKECVAEDYRRCRAEEGKTAFPEEVAKHLEILVLAPGLFFRLYLQNPSLTHTHRFEGMLMGKVIDSGIVT